MRIFTSICILISCIVLLACESESKVCFEENCFIVEVVDTPQSRAKGLMFREHIEYNQGMFFVFETPGVYPFWMKNTLIPLDIIWISEGKEIVHISQDTQPCEKDPCPSYNPGREAKYALEVNAGLTKRLGIKIGNNVKIANS